MEAVGQLFIMSPPAGKALVTVWNKALDDLYRKIFKGFDKELINHLVEDLNLMISNLNEIEKEA